MQQLTAAAHQALAAGQGMPWVLSKGLSQFRQGLVLIVRERLRRLAQFAAEEGAEGFAATLQVREAPIRLQQQGLLQRPQPGLQR